MENKGKVRANGITLVALVVTIIILLILAGISIQTITQTNLFDKAKQAKNITENAQKEENKVLLEYIDKMNKYFPETLSYKVKKGKVAIGSYVNYEPDAINKDNESYKTLISNLGIYSGTDDNTTENLSQEKNLKWRILDVKDGEVRLISSEPTTSKIKFFGAKGYNNAVYLLDKTCSTLYSKSGYSNSVQNLKIEDIQDYTSYDYTQNENLYVDTKKYGGTNIISDKKYYPYLFKKEKTGCVDDKNGEELDLSQQIELVNETSNEAKTSIKITQTYWYKILEKNNFPEPIYYELFIGNEDYYQTYWMSSRCVDALYDGSAGFIIRFLYAGHIAASYLYYSDGKEDSINLSFRPCITLNSNILISSGEGTIDQPYEIKLQNNN